MPRRASEDSRAVLGVDLGTSSAKACVLDGAGRVRGQAQADYPTHHPHPGWSEQDPVDWWPAVVRAVRAAVRRCGVDAGAIGALGLTSAAHIGVLLDEHDQPLRPAILWNDQRTAEQVRELEQQAGDVILKRSLQAVSTSWTLAHLAWVARHEPRVWRQVRRVLLSKDFLAWQLTGQTATDPATAVSAQLWDAGRQRWCPRLCSLAGLDVACLPPVRASTDVVGELKGDMAKLLGLRPGTPVVNGSLDTATELLAAGVHEPGQGMIRLATAGGLQVVVSRARASRRCITYPHVLAPYWYCQAGTNTCAAAVQWAADLLGVRGRERWSTWDRQASSAQPGSAGVQFHPYLAGERAPYWNPSLRGSFRGLGLHHSAGHLARALYEGTAMSIRDAMRGLPAAPEPGATLAVAGGGARSAVWLQILADVLRHPLRVADDADSACGAAMLALHATGRRADLQAAAAVRATLGRRVEPDPARASLYDELFSRYRQVARQMVSPTASTADLHRDGKTLIV